MNAEFAAGRLLSKADLYILSPHLDKHVPLHPFLLTYLLWRAWRLSVLPTAQPSTRVLDRHLSCLLQDLRGSLSLPWIFSLLIAETCLGLSRLRNNDPTPLSSYHSSLLFLASSIEKYGHFHYIDSITLVRKYMETK